MAGGLRATVVDTRVEQLIAAELPRVIGAAARYDVNVDGLRETGEIIDIRRVRIVGERVERAGSPVLERIDVTMIDLVVDRKEKRLQSLGMADASALLLPADIAAFLDTRPGLDNVRVALFPPSEITIETQVRNWRICLSQVHRRKDSRTTDRKRWPPHHGNH